MVRFLIVTVFLALAAPASANQPPCTNWQSLFDALHGKPVAEQRAAVARCKDQINWTKHARYGFSALSSAILDGDPTLFGVLLEAGLDPDMQDESGETAAHWLGVSTANVSPARGQTIIAQIVAAGGNLNLEDRYGQTPLFVAIDFDELEIAEMLIKAGADMTYINSRGRSALFSTFTGTCDVESGHFLLDQGLRMDAMPTFQQELMWDGSKVTCSGSADAEAYRQRMLSTAGIPRGKIFSD